MTKEQEYYDLERVYEVYNNELDDDKFYFKSHPRLLKEIIEEKDNVIVILADKGGGKTTEIKQFCKDEKNKNSSIYIELKDIYSNEKDLKKELNSLETNNNIYLFFDSIDECRIQSTISQDAFEVTLNKIRECLMSNTSIVDKMKFIFTSRKSDWFKNTDIKLIEEKLKITTVKSNDEKLKYEKASLNTMENDKGKEIKNNEIKVSVYELAYLTEKQQRLIAEKLKIDINIIKDDVMAKEYSKTPLDCIETIKFKARYKNNEYKTEDFLRYKLQRRYRELNENYKNQLSMEKIEFLSKRLAVATLFCKTISIKKKESYTDIHKSINDISVFDLFPEEDSNCLEKFLNSTLFISNGENTVKFWDELCKDNIAYFWFRDRISNGKYSKIKTLLFQKHNDIFSPKQNFIVPIVFLANDEPEFRKYLIKFNPELLIKYSYCCESLTEFDKTEIIDLLLEKYPYRIMSIISPFYNNLDKSYIPFCKNLNIEDIIDKLKNTQKEYYWRELFLVELLHYSNLKDIDEKLTGSLNDILWFFIRNKKNRSFNEVAIEILLKQESLKINEEIKKYIENNISTIPEYIIIIYIENSYPKFISFSKAIELLHKYFQQNKEKICICTYF